MAARRGGIALTHSDAPYTFVLKKGKQKEAVLRITDLGETDVPMVLESKMLGIKLVADVQAPPNEADGGKKQYSPTL